MAMIQSPHANVIVAASAKRMWKRKLAKENQPFDEEWTEAYLIILLSSSSTFGSMCLICNESIAEIIRIIM